MSSKTKQQKPKWFKGMIYSKGETITNPFSGESYDLTGLETSIYDFIIGCQMVFESAPSTITKKRTDEFQKALNWFRTNNPQAYYVLLDQQQFSYPRQLLNRPDQQVTKVTLARTQKVRAFRGMRTFDKYKANLREHNGDIWSYSTKVAETKDGKLHQLGWWSVTTQKHVNYVAKELSLELIK